MLTRFIIVAVLVHLAIGRFAPKERQWNPEDARQNCTNRCEDHCICKVPNKCSEDETKCGEAPPENHPDCPPDEICVPSDCNCKSILLNTNVTRNPIYFNIRLNINEKFSS